MHNTIRLLAGFALILGGCFAASAQTGQTPPATPDTSATPPAECIAENDTYIMRGKTPTFVIELENKCEQRMKCRVFAYVTSAKGAAQGQGTLRLAPKSHGAAAKKSYTMRVKMMGGSSQSTRECSAY